MTSGRVTVVEDLLDAMDPGTGQPWTRCYLTTKAPWFDRSGEVLGLIGVARDITKRKAEEAATRSANIEKDVLLADINHRIKNHLLSISGLIRMSRRCVTTLAEAEEALDAAAARLTVLGRVYDRLQVREAQTAVRADDFLEGLGADLRVTLVDLRPIAVIVRADPVALDANRAATVGLVVNELVQNALKYASPEDRAGSISVRLTCPDEECRLEVADDGLGLSPDGADHGTGSRLIRALAQQLEGQLEWAGPPGTRVTLRFLRTEASAAPV